MNTRILFRTTIFILVLITSCYREQNNNLLQQKGKSQTKMIQLLQQIDSLSNLNEYDLYVVKNYIAKAEEFSSTYPEDPMSADFLYKAGLMAMTIAKVTESQEETDFYCQKALSIFGDIQRVYPDFLNIKNCILNKGVIYDDILHDYANAEILYREFIARYPTDTLAINIESYLQYIGKTPEEIMAEIEK